MSEPFFRSLRHRTAAAEYPAELVGELLDHAPVAIAILEARELRFVLANPRYEQLVAQGALLQRPIAEVFPEAYAAGIGAMLDKARGGERVSLREYAADLSPHGSPTTWWNADYIPLHDRNGTVHAILVIGQEVTEQVRTRRRVEELAAEAQNALRQLNAVVETIDEALVIADLQGNLLRMNAAALQLHGVEDASAQPHVSAFPQHFHVTDLQGRVLRPRRWPLARALQGEEFRDVRLRVRRRDTGKEWIGSYSGSPVRDATGAAMLAVVTIRDVTAAEQAAAEREALLARLALADRRKDEFLAMLAHELRNPLAPIANAVHLLRTDPSGDNSARAIELIERQSRHLTRLVDDLLDTARIATGRIRLRRKRIELGSLAQHAADDVRPAFEAGSIDFWVELPREPLYIEADPTRITQVLHNLLNNAAKYTDAGGRVSLSVRQDGGQAAITVADSGVGLDAEQLGQIFDLFGQVDPGIDRSKGGLGLGLNLVKRLAQKHGGTATASSPGRGAGSEFVVRLPLRAASAALPDSSAD